MQASDAGNKQVTHLEEHIDTSIMGNRNRQSALVLVVIAPEKNSVHGQGLK
jgi:hypothetical protein